MELTIGQLAAGLVIISQLVLFGFYVGRFWMRTNDRLDDHGKRLTRVDGRLDKHDDRIDELARSQTLDVR